MSRFSSRAMDSKPRRTSIQTGGCPVGVTGHPRFRDGRIFGSGLGSFPRSLSGWKCAWNHLAHIRLMTLRYRFGVRLASKLNGVVIPTQLYDKGLHIRND